MIELMIVVAIIGILSAIAIPNFRSYQARARTSEARVLLANAYTAAEIIHQSFDHYAHCLKWGGFDPSNGDGTILTGTDTTLINPGYYAVGFRGSAQADFYNFEPNPERWSACAANGGVSTAPGFYWYPSKAIGPLHLNKNHGEGFAYAEGKYNIGGEEQEVYFSISRPGKVFGPLYQSYWIGATGRISNISDPDNKFSSYGINQNRQLIELRSGF